VIGIRTAIPVDCEAIWKVHGSAIRQLPDGTRLPCVEMSRILGEG